MLDKNSIQTLKLIPEVDMNRATQQKFNNSDKQALEVRLGSEEASRAAFYAIQIAIKDEPIQTGQ